MLTSDLLTVQVPDTLFYKYKVENSITTDS